jgi:hypothetical protein
MTDTSEQTGGAMRENTNLRFFYNGIKGSDGKLQKVHYSDGELIHFPAGTLTIYGKEYRRFSDEVRSEFTVENESDMMTDYCEDDRIRVEPSHPLYPNVLVAMQAQKAHRERKAARTI